jgi:polar amino acid transport system substrate-binding protein
MSKNIFQLIMYFTLLVMFQPAYANEAVEQANIKTDSNVIKICYLDWGKFGGENLPGKGVILDIATEVLENAGYQVQADILPWKRCVLEVSQHNYDLVAGAWETETHSQNFEYIETINLVTVNFIALNGAPYKSQNTLEELFQHLQGKSVGLVGSSGYPERFTEQIEKFSAIWVANLKQSIDMLLFGRVDLLVSDPQVVYSDLESSGNDLNQVVVLTPPIAEVKQSTMISKTHPRKQEITKRFKLSYQALVKDGLYQKIIERHQLKDFYY